MDTLYYILQFKDNYDKLFKWLEDSEDALHQDRRVNSDPDALKDQLKRHKVSVIGSHI